MPLRKLWLCTCLTALAVSPALAQPGPPGGGPGGPGGRGPGPRGGGNNPEAAVQRLFQLDADGDGKLAKSEVSDSRLQAVFTRADADKDGIVTREEATAMFAKEAGPQGPGGRGGPGAGPGGPGAGPGGFGGGPGGPGGFGGPPGGGRMRPGQVLPPFLVDQLELTEKQRDELDALQKDVDARLAKILTDEQRERLTEMSQRGPGGPGGAGPGGPGGGGPAGPRGPGQRGGRPPTE